MDTPLNPELRDETRPKASVVPFWKPVNRPLTRVTWRPATVKVLEKQPPLLSLAPRQPLGTCDTDVQGPVQSADCVSTAG
jgi:hypothetical protein